MSRAMGLEIVKFCAGQKKFTVQEIANHVLSSKSNIRDWLYDMEKLGLVRPGKRISRTIVPGASTRGRQDIQQWEWLL